MFAIVRDEKRLALLCQSIGKETASLHENMHIAVVSSLVKAAEGGIQPLRMLWPNLSEQYRRNLKTYHRRINAHLYGDADGLHGDANSFLMFTDGNWYIRQGTKEERKVFVELAETVLINPENAEDRFGKKWDWFWSAGYIPRPAVEFKDGALLKSLKRLRDNAEIGKVNAQGVQTMVSLISPEVRQELNISIAKIEQAIGIESSDEGFGPVFDRSAYMHSRSLDGKKVKPTLLTPAIQATELSASVEEINKGRKRPLNKKDTEANQIVG